jgi:hypothetical protein
MTKKRQFCPRSHDTFRFGRDPGHRCLKCREEDAEALLALAAAEAAEREAEQRRRDEEADRRREREYQRAIKAGGDVAANARWERLYVQTVDEGRYGLCQWALDSGEPGACTRRTTADPFCSYHYRQLDREVGTAWKKEER